MTEQQQLYQVAVPSGIPPGHNFSVMAGDHRLMVTVPPNASAGQMLSIQAPAVSAGEQVPPLVDDTESAIQNKPKVLKQVGKGCCRCCGCYKMGKQACPRCGYKYCLECSHNPGLWFSGGTSCANCHSQSGSTMDMAAPKGCCAACFGPAMQKRPCTNCEKKYCDKCVLWNLGKERCSQCMTPESEYEEPVYGYSICAHCQKVPGSNALRCVVCGKRYCATCAVEVLGDKCEGLKCISCVGSRPHQALLPVPPIPATTAFRSLLPSHSISVNGQPLTEVQLWVLLCEPLVFSFLRGGLWWYDQRSGWLGKWGKGPKAVIRPGLTFGSSAAVGTTMDPLCSGGTTGIFLNGRQIVENERLKYSLASVQLTPGYWFYEHNGDYGPLTGPDAGRVHGNFWKKGGRNLAIGLGLAVVGFAGTELLAEGAFGGAEGALGGAGGGTTEFIEGSGMIGTTSDGRTIFAGSSYGGTSYSAMI